MILYAMWLSFLRLFHELACQADKSSEADDADEQGRFAECTDVAEDDARDEVIGICEGRTCKAQVAEDRQDEQRQPADEQTVNGSADDRTAATAFCITVDGSCGTAEEVTNNAWDDDDRAKGNHAEHRDRTDDEADEEAKQNSVRCVREDDRNIQCRFRIRHELHGNALESRDDFCQDHADALQDDCKTCSKRTGLHDGIDDVIRPFAEVFFDELLARHQSEDDVNDSHDDRDGDR